MSEPHEFGGPVNRPAHNARQVTPGQAFDNQQPAGGGLDFLGLNEQVQSTGPSTALTRQVVQATPATADSWLLEMREAPPIDLSPPRTETVGQPTAVASLLNTSWREEVAPKRNVRWLAPVAVGAALAAIGMIGLPRLRQQPKSDATLGSVALTPHPPASDEQGPASPTSAAAAAGDAVSVDTVVAPVEPDPQLDRERPERGGRARNALARNAQPAAGRSEAPVHAPAPGESFVPPVEVHDPAGVWSVQPSEGAQGAEGDVETTEPVEGAPDGSASASENGAASGDHAAISGECEPELVRRLPPAEDVAVDWDRLVWLARSTDPGFANASAASANAEAPTEMQDSATEQSGESGLEAAVARAVLAWSGAGEVEVNSTDSESAPGAVTEVSAASESVDSVSESTLEPVGSVAIADDAPAQPLDSSPEVALESVESAAPPSADSPINSLAPVVEAVVEAVVESQPTNDAEVAQPSPIAVEPLGIPAQPEEFQPTDAAPVVTDASPSKAVRVLARGSRRVAAREQAAARRSARRATAEAAEVGLVPVAQAELEPPQVAQPEAAQPILPPAEVGTAQLAPSEVAQPEASVTPKPSEPADAAPSPAVAAEPSASAPTPAETTQQAIEPPLPAAAAVVAAAPQSALPALEVANAQTEAVPTSANQSAPAAPTQLAQEPAATTSGVASAPPPPPASVGAAPTTTKSLATEPEPKRVLQVARPEDLKQVWSGDSIPLESVSSRTQLATPEIGRTRVVFHTGEVFEGDLVAVGEGSLWLRTTNGRLALDGARVKSAVRIDSGASASTSGAAPHKLAGLPRARVQTPGGTLHGRVLERDELRTTLVTDSGARIVLDSRLVELSSDRPLVQIRP